MRSSGNWLRRQVASCLVLVLAAPFADFAIASSVQTQAPANQQGSQQGSADATTAPATASPQANAQPGPQSTVPQPQASPSGQTPDAGNPPAIGDSTSGSTQGLSSQGSTPQNASPDTAPSTAQQGQQRPDDTAPVGSAAAPYEKGVGNAASRPAGAAIAPAKQKRTRSILIRVGILVGAAAAIGTVVGLSASSPSRPN